MSTRRRSDNWILPDLPLIGLAGPLRKWQVLIVSFQPWLLVIATIGAIISALYGIYPIYIIILAVVAYVVNIFVAGRVLSVKNPPKFVEGHFSLKFLRGLIGLVLVCLGLIVLHDSRDSLWLLLVVPIWRITIEDNFPPWATIIGLLIGGTAILIQTILASVSFDAVAFANVALKSLWLVIIVGIVGAYVEFVNRVTESDKKREELDSRYYGKLQNVHNLENWARLIVSELLELTGADYATFQVANHFTGYLNLVVAMRLSDGVPNELPTARLEAQSLKFSQIEDKGLTAIAAREGKTISDIDVSRNPNYFPLFPGVIAEIASPIHDRFYGRVGGVINVEFLKENRNRPQSDVELMVYKEMVRVYANQVGISLGYIFLSNMRNRLRELGVQLASADKEVTLAFYIIETLYELYGCAAAIWFVETSQYGNDVLVLRGFRGLSNSLRESFERLRFEKSHLGRLIQNSLGEIVQVENIDKNNTDKWVEVNRLHPMPTSTVLIPLVDRENSENLGAIVIFAPKYSRLSLHERDVLKDLSSQVCSSVARFRRKYEVRTELLKYEATAAAHDMGSSITNISSFLRNLLVFAKYKLEDTAVSELEDLSESLFAELSYLEDVRDLIGHQFTTSSSISKSRYKLDDLISRVTRQLENRGELTKGQVVIKKPDGLSTTVYGNRPIIVGALKNVIRNASEAGIKGSPIEIEMAGHEESKSLEICIINYGPPIEEEFRKQLWDPGKSTKGGQGIGLGVYRYLVRSMGGGLILKESSSQRTVFALVLSTSADQQEPSSSARTQEEI